MCEPTSPEHEDHGTTRFELSRGLNRAKCRETASFWQVRVETNQACLAGPPIALPEALVSAERTRLCMVQRERSALNAADAELAHTSRPDKPADTPSGTNQAFGGADPLSSWRHESDRIRI